MKHLIVAIAFALMASAAQAAVLSWSAPLEPGQEVPPVLNAPDATGSATGTIDTDTNLLTWNIVWSGLTGNVTAMHFHGPAPVGENTGIQVTIGDTTSPSTGSSPIDPADTGDLLDGLWYINIHTARNPGGEIRGQVIPAPIPVPATLPLLLGAGALLGVCARRRRRA